MAAPMTPSQLVAALRAEGLDPQFPYGAWATHERDGATGRPFGPVYGVVIHHTAGTNSLSVVWNGTGDLPGPLAHSHLPKNGKPNMISAGRANHAGTFAQNAHNAVLNESSVHPYPDAAEPVDGNDAYYGLEIENLGNGTDVYPIEQYIAAVKWATAICRSYGWSKDSVIGHKEGTRRKIDPKGPVEGDGFFDMNEFRDDVAEALSLPAGAWANEEEDVSLTPEQDKKLTELHNRLYPYAGWSYKGEGETRDAYWYQRETKKEVDTVKVAVAEVKAKVDSIAVGGVDLDALAVKVADEIYRRMAG